MWISVTFVNGPLEGTVEFDDHDSAPLTSPDLDELSQAKSFYARTKGEIGRGFNGLPIQTRSQLERVFISTRQRSALYRVEACEERNGVRYVRAQLFPK